MARKVDNTLSFLCDFLNEKLRGRSSSGSECLLFTTISVIMYEIVVTEARDKAIFEAEAAPVNFPPYQLFYYQPSQPLGGKNCSRFAYTGLHLYLVSTFPLCLLFAGRLGGNNGLRGWLTNLLGFSKQKVGELANWTACFSNSSSTCFAVI